MKVKPALFDKVIANIRTLVEVRGASIYPSIVIQFLLDRANITRMVEMYDLGRSLGVDRVAMNAVLEIPRERIDRELLLRPEDAAPAEPFIEEVLRKDADAGLLQLDFAVYGFNDVMKRVRARVGGEPTNMYPTAPSFRDRNDGCFFAWYTAAVTGNGDIRPCCLLLNPDVKPLGNIHEKSISEHWRGEAFQKMRTEMREVLLRGGKVEVVRKKEVRWIGSPAAMKRRADIFLFDHPRVKEMVRGDRLRKMYDWMRDSSRPARVALKRRLHINLTDAA
jgi:MoaA/NifB/PqqE/SkfB family radical SAM enzyme